jgi:hypothetical protein
VQAQLLLLLWRRLLLMHLWDLSWQQQHHWVMHGGLP